jgi:diguanylate cyclase (GGDEF)-like protein
LIVVVTVPLSETLSVWYGQVLWGFVALILITFVVAIFSARLVRALQLQENRRIELTLLATTDSLTGALNRRRFVEVGMEEFSRSKRYDNPMSLLMLDIDHFKNINDTWGHAAGDKILKALTETINSITREPDGIGRLGGEEFAVILPETDLTDAAVIAERMRYAVHESTSVSVDAGKSVRVTVSIGVAALNSNDVSFDDILSRADDCLYNAKKNGRNCVVSVYTQSR